VSAAEVVAREELPGARVFEVAVGNLLTQRVDAIVNAANGRLAHGGGVAAAIARAAGPELEDEGDRLVARQGTVATGDAVVTTAGRLPFRAVIHAVGPHRGEGDEETLLVSALRAAFERAADLALESVAFPAVSSGIFAVPLEVCARAYVRAVREHVGACPASSLRLLRLCLVAGPLVELVTAEFARRRPGA
jgi:O-acetyl-ADP-ribose deacetylase